MYLNLYNIIQHTGFAIVEWWGGLDREKRAGHSPKAKIEKKVNKIYVNIIDIIIRSVPES